MTLKDGIEKWLKEHPKATAQEAIWAGAVIEMTLWMNRSRD